MTEAIPKLSWGLWEMGVLRGAHTYPSTPEALPAP